MQILRAEHRLSKGEQVNIPVLQIGFLAVTQMKLTTSAGVLGRVLFSF